jgi:hypothetical protein
VMRCQVGAADSPNSRIRKSTKMTPARSMLA